MLLESFIEALLIYCETVFLCKLDSELDGEAVGIIELEGKAS